MAEAAEVAIQQQEAQNTESVDDTIPPEADSEAQNTETGEQPEQPAESTEQQEAKRQSKFQRRLERQKTARIQAETEARLLREQNARLEEQLRRQPTPKEEAPKRENFESYEDYLDARQDWRASQRKTEEQPQQQPEKRPQASPQEAIAKEWGKREDAFKATAKDFEAVVEPFVSEDIGALSDQARRAILESDNGPRLLYHLAKNEADVERIADLSPARQVAALVELEDKLTSEPTKRPSNAPPPIRPVTQNANAKAAITGNETQAEYEAKRKAQGARWGR